MGNAVMYKHMYRALITGGSRGIGKSVKELFVKHGIDVIAPGRKELDLADNENIKQFVSGILPVDILINCAGINNLASLEEMTPEMLQEMIQIDLTAQTLLLKYASAGMIKNNWGRVVNFSSIWSAFSKKRRIMYSLSKAGVNGLTTAAAVELGQYNILVNAVAPGFVLTELTYQNNTMEQIKEISESVPVKRMAQPEEIAEFVYFLASPKNTFITGQTIFIDGGFSCV